jgi:hypothetical protein
MTHQIPRPVKMKKRIPFFAFLLFYLAFSFVTYRDYGSTWDEQDTYQGGADLYQYLIHGAPMAYMDPEHTYPYTFLLNFITGQTNYETFHLLNLLFGSLLFWALFETLFSVCGSALWALSGPVFLFLMLPFLGSIPANPKDIPFAIFYFLSLTVIYLFDRIFPGLKFRWFFLGLLFGFTISSRIVGFTLFPILLFYDLYLYWMGKRNGKIQRQDAKTPSKASFRKDNKKLMGTETEKDNGFQKWIVKKVWGWFGTLVVSQVLCAILWPFIGQNYFKNLPFVFLLSARFPPKFAFLFMGKMADSLTYPWYCLPLWIGITTPLFILAFFLGSFWLLKKAKTDALYVLLLSAFILNLGLYFFLHPAVYDGLRHFLFLLPLLAALAAMGFIEFFQKKPWGRFQKATAGLTLVGVLATAVQLVLLHPYEYTYFNILVGGFKGAYGNYETDYWVASMKEAVQWLKSNEIKDPNRIYKIYADGKPFQSETNFSPNMVFEPKMDQADFAIIMTRAGIKPAPEDEGKVIHRVEREGAPLSFILKLH